MPRLGHTRLVYESLACWPRVGRARVHSEHEVSHIGLHVLIHGPQIRCHKLALASASPVFAAMLTGGLMEGQPTCSEVRTFAVCCTQSHKPIPTHSVPCTHGPSHLTIAALPLSCIGGH